MEFGQMGIDGTFAIFGISLQVFLVDLLLSGDNAVVIALACRTLPEKQRRLAMLYGAGAGILLRIFLSLVVDLLLKIPLLKILGAIALLLIAIGLMTEEEEIAEDIEGTANQNLPAAVMTIVMADLVMSLDNVVALAAVSQESISFLALGLLLSVPLLIFGSGLLSRLMDEMPELITLGGALLGWVAGSIAVTDPLIADWVRTQSPALAVVVPLSTAILTVLQSRRLVAERRRLGPQVRQPLKLPSIQLWPAAGRAAEPEPALAPAAAQAVMPLNLEVEAAPVAAAAAGFDREIAVDDDLALLIGDGRRTPPSEPVGETAADSPSRVPISARWDMKIAFGLVIFVMLLVMLMAGVDDVDDDRAGSVAREAAGTAVAPPLKRFQCGMYGSEFFYNHGAMQVRFQANGVVLSGILNRNSLTWNAPAAGSPPLGLQPPRFVLDDDAKSVTIEGGSFTKTVCHLVQASQAGP